LLPKLLSPKTATKLPKTATLCCRFWRLYSRPKRQQIVAEANIVAKNGNGNSVAQNNKVAGKGDFVASVDMP